MTREYSAAEIDWESQQSRPSSQDKPADSPREGPRATQPRIFHYAESLVLARRCKGPYLTVLNFLWEMHNIISVLFVNNSRFLTVVRAHARAESPQSPQSLGKEGEGKPPLSPELSDDNVMAARRRIAIVTTLPCIRTVELPA